jgi:hypothetical protein
MRQTIFLLALVAVATVAMAVAASAECHAIGANQPASVVTSCGAPLPVATSCAAATSCAPAAPSCVPAGHCSATGAQRWSADLLALPGAAVAQTACGCAQPSAQGRADFQLTPQGDVLRYWLNVSDINCVNGAQIRLVAPGGDVTTAPTVAYLYQGPVRSGEVSGRLSRGNITCADLMGPLQGQPLSALLEAMTNGQAVVVVDTTTHPQGEIAGIPGCSGLA